MELLGTALGQGIMGEGGQPRGSYALYFVQTERPVDLFYTSDNKDYFWIHLRVLSGKTWLTGVKKGSRRGGHQVLVNALDG